MKPTKFRNMVHQETNLGINANIPVKTQRSDNIVVRLQHRTIITLRCKDVLVVVTESQRCSNSVVVSSTQGLFPMFY